MRRTTVHPLPAMPSTDATTESRIATLESTVAELQTELTDLREDLQAESEARTTAQARASRAETIAVDAIQAAHRAHERLDSRAAVRMDAPDPTSLQVEPTCDANPMPLGTILTSKATHGDVDALRRVLFDPTADTTPEDISGLTDTQASFIDDHGTIIGYLTSGDGHASSDRTATSTIDRVSHETAKLRRKLHSVAEQAGLTADETTDAAAEQDKLNRLLKYGPSDVVDRVHNVHERARTLLEHAGEWGRRASDKFGTRITLTGAAVKERLSLARDEQLSSTEVRRVFQKLEALAKDSPRKVVADTGGRGQNRLVIYLTDAEVNRLT